jgi:polysaccharide export outer membrane protein
MFKTGETSKIEQFTKEAERNYVIQKNDYLSLDVFTNDGERIVDPDFKLLKDIPTQTGNLRPELNYLVNAEGHARFPLLGLIKIEGMKLIDAETILQKEYTKFYEKPFVRLNYINKRVIILGATGGQVIPLANENMTLVEILAIAKGLPTDAKAHNIRILRGEQAFVADLSTIEGFTKGNMLMAHGDVVYIEPVRRPFVEGLRDYGPALTLLTSLTTLVVVIISL